MNFSNQLSMMRARLGLRGQAQCDPALVSVKTCSCHTKAPSPLHPAGAVPK